jgi:hypothetical protein
MDFELYREHSFEMWVRLFDINSTIFSFRGIPTWEGFSSLELLDKNNRWPTATATSFYNEGALNASGYLEFYTDAYTTGNAYRYDGQWVHVSGSVGVDGDVEQTTLTYWVNGVEVGSTVSDQVIFDNQDGDNYLGASYGVLNNMNGLFYSFNYAAYPRTDWSGSFGSCGSACTVCPPEGCLSNCGVT